MGADSLAENTPNASKSFSPKCLPQPKSSRFLKKSSLWVSVVRLPAKGKVGTNPHCLYCPQNLLPSLNLEINVKVYYTKQTDAHINIWTRCKFAKEISLGCSPLNLRTGVGLRDSRESVAFSLSRGSMLPISSTISAKVYWGAQYATSFGG